MEKVHAVEFKNITKRFGRVTANDGINLYLDRGVIMSLLGENGSGKTSLMNMLAGIYFPDEGEIYVDGKNANITCPEDSFKHGIGMIHQHFKLVDIFTATENIVLGLEDKYDIKAASAKVKEICDRYGFDIDPDKKIYEMSVSEKQTVEIVKVLYRGADILILDEPTAVLTPQETEKLFFILRAMRQDGKAIILITHKLNEVMSVSDVVAVLRKGQHIATVRTAETDEQKLTEMMVGHAVTLNIDRFDVVDLIRNLLQRVAPLGNDDAITVRFETTEPVFVWSDEFRIEQVLKNYISNAFHYVAGDKIIEVTVSTTEEGRVRVSVFNSGAPIPEEQVPLVWEKFYKADASRSREYGGSGVGLSIVKAIAESLNLGYGITNYENGVAFYVDLDSE